MTGDHYTLRWYEDDKLVYITNVLAPSSLVALTQAWAAIDSRTAEAFEKGHTPNRVTAQFQAISKL